MYAEEPRRMTDDDQEPAFGACIGIRRSGGHLGVIALRPARAGQVILCVEGLVVRRPSRHSLQIGEHAHIALPDGVDPESAPARFLWCYLNHSCAPCARFEGPDLIAVHDIVEGEEITFDYNTTEYDIAEPFVCGCGACDGAWIRGFKHLDFDKRFQIAVVLAPHLRRRFDVQLTAPRAEKHLHNPLDHMRP